MPGFSMIVGNDGDLDDARVEAARCLDGLFHTARYERKILLDEPQRWVAWSAYPEYGLADHSNDSYVVLQEGQIYGVSPAALREDLAKLAPMLFDPRGVYRAAIVDWLSRTDGEFLLIVIDKATGDIAILNDLLGKLPFYHSCRGGRFVASREVNFVTRMAPDRSCDRTALIQFLTLRYCLDDRTFYQSIKRLTPASILTIRDSGSSTTVDKLHEYNLSERRHSDRSYEQNVDNTLELLTEATVARACRDGSRRNGLMLSGGIDSRIVGAILQQHGIPFSCTSFTTEQGIGALDAKNAREVAELLGWDWSMVEVGAPSGQDALDIFKLKGGLMSMTLAPLMSYIRQMQARLGEDQVFFTGDTGYGVRSFYPKAKARTTEDLVTRNMFAYHAQFKMEEIAGLFRVSPAEVLKVFTDHFNSYPETDPVDRWHHYIICQRILVWNYDGMDRTRAFAWLAAPFDATPFFHYAMHLPNKHKDHYEPYWDWFKRIAPDAMKVDYAPYNAKPKSLKLDLIFARQKLFFNNTPRWLQAAIRRVRWAARGQFQHNPNLIRCLQAQLSNCPAISEYLDPKKVQELVSSNARTQLETLLSLTSAIEMTHTGHSSMEQFRETSLL
jgi:asparagine synthase (glutamine-hydrolysing)